MVTEKNDKPTYSDCSEGGCEFRTGLSLIHEREKEKRRHILINTESFSFMQCISVLMGIVHQKKQVSVEL
jgi:hypothetical protein